MKSVRFEIEEKISRSLRNDILFKIGNRIPYDFYNKNLWNDIDGNLWREIVSKTSNTHISNFINARKTNLEKYGWFK